MLASDARAPKYVRIADTMRRRIARGALIRGARLPANEALAAEFGVSRVTVRQAVDLLVREGLVAPRQGSGTYVTDAPPETRWLRVETSLAALAEVYRDTSPEILTIAEDTEGAAPRLLPEDGVPAERYVGMRRLHSRAGEPYCVIAIHLDQTIFRRDPERFRREVVIPILAAMRRPRVARARQTFTIGTADIEVAALLRVPLGAPVAEVRRVFCDDSGRVLYLGEVTYRGDSVRIEMDLKP